jgi:hypothetical protein
MTRGGTLLAILGAALGLGSCVGLDASVSIAEDGSGSIEIQYAVPVLLAPLGSLDPNERIIPLPVSRESFDGAIRGAEGISILTYSRADGLDEVRVAVSLSFADIGALAACLDPGGSRIRYSEAAGTRSLRILVSTGDAAGDPRLVALSGAAFAKYRMSLTLRLAVPLKSSGVAAVSADGRQAVFSIGAVEAARSLVPIEWLLSW